jgi:hypothetical protein
MADVMAIRVLLLLLLSGLACGRVALDQPPDDVVGGGGGASGIAGEPGGMGGRGEGGSSGIGGGSGVGGNQGTGGAGVNCPTLGESGCLAASPACRADYCPSCYTPKFVGCAFQNGPTPICGPAPPCVPPPPCAMVTTLADCEQRYDCHSVFVHNATSCDCATCCETFIACADGDRADCGPRVPLCKSIAPPCDSGYLVSYTDVCFEGCVAIKDCGSPLPPPPPPPPPP